MATSLPLLPTSLVLARHPEWLTRLTDCKRRVPSSRRS